MLQVPRDNFLFEYNFQILDKGELDKGEIDKNKMDKNNNSYYGVQRYKYI
jgi:hypothetical protein